MGFVLNGLRTEKKMWKHINKNNVWPGGRTPPLENISLWPSEGLVIIEAPDGFSTHNPISSLKAR